MKIISLLRYIPSKVSKRLNLKARNKIEREQLAATRLQLKQAREQAKTTRGQLELAREQAQFTRDQLDEARGQSWENKERLNELRENVKKAAPFVNILKSLNSISDNAGAFQSDVFLAVTAEAVPYAFAAAKDSSVPVICDCTEIPSLDVRTLKPDWSEPNMRMMNNALYGYLYDVSSFLSVGWELSKYLVRYDKSVKVIPNFRYNEEHVYSDVLRKRLNIQDETKIIMAMSTIASDFDVILNALSLIENAHLVILGKLVPLQYKEEMLQLAENLGLSDRFHTVEQVDYSELTPTLSSADVGIIVRDPSILNNHVSLPNRIFDYMFAGVPVVTPNIPDISKIVLGEKMGGVVYERTPQAWAQSIQEVLEQQVEMRINALEAAKKMTWETQEDDIYESLGEPRSITLFGQKNLLKHNRSMRIVQTLLDRDVDVKIAVYDNFVQKFKDENGEAHQFKLIGF
ncbi:glycosyltransferase [Planktotalea frisia]|nr:glycosyltransferase [Planktotalea frisia]